MPRRASLLLFALMFLPGCVLGVGWLPDSSGFYYTTPSGKLMAYDLKAKKSRLVWEDAAAAETTWPAVSGDGKAIALARLTGLGNEAETSLLIVAVDPRGQVAWKSDAISLGKAAGKDLEYMATLFWSPDGGQLLVHGMGVANQGEGLSASVLYDVATKKTKVWPKHVPAVFGGTPIRPDGKGFLLARDQGGDAQAYVWVDWQGKEQQIVGNHGQSESPPTWSALADSRWDGVEAIVTVNGSRYSINTEKRLLTGAVVKRADLALGKEIIRKRTSLAGGGELLLLEKGEEGGKEAPQTRVVFRQKPGDEPVAISPPVRERITFLSPAPDGKHAVARVSFGPRGRKGDTIHVIDAAGTALDQFLIDPKE